MLHLSRNSHDLKRSKNSCLHRNALGAEEPITMTRSSAPKGSEAQRSFQALILDPSATDIFGDHYGIGKENRKIEI